jgi:hypothetical protein
MGKEPRTTGGVQEACHSGLDERPLTNILQRLDTGILLKGLWILCNTLAMQIDPTVLTVFISSLSSIFVSFGIAALTRRKTRAEADKVATEAEQIRRRLERGEAFDILLFIDSVFQLLDTAYGLITLSDRILKEYPVINHGAREEVDAKRACLREIHSKMREYFSLSD